MLCQPIESPFSSKLIPSVTTIQSTRFGGGPPSRTPWKDRTFRMAASSSSCAAFCSGVSAIGQPFFFLRPGRFSLSRLSFFVPGFGLPPTFLTSLRTPFSPLGPAEDPLCGLLGPDHLVGRTAQLLE